jgi:hypothetical protein
MPLRIHDARWRTKDAQLRIRNAQGRIMDVHDSKVRRITAITPDMVGPKPHDSPTGFSPPFANRSTISPSGVGR